MSYLHCHNCNWSQDDFWTENYNPITYLEKSFKRQLLDEPLKRITELERHVRTDDGCVVFKEKITNKEWIAQVIENSAFKIRGMVYKTLEEFKEKNPERKCPNCGKQELDID